MRLFRAVLPFVFALAVATCFGEGEQQFASIGDLKLVSGKTLKHVQVGYRTFGTLNAEKSNAVLFPTWYLGKSADLAGSIGPGRLVDSSKYYVIAVDALTNGVSTSPSNSKDQPEGKFPAVSIRDIVESQHRALIGLGIRHLRAVVGISMGGVQAFNWVTAYPEFVDLAVPIVGSPRASSYDMLFYGAGIKALKAAEAIPSARTELVKAFADNFWLALNTPSYFVRSVKREATQNAFDGFEKNLLAWDVYNMAAGLESLQTNDAFAPYGGDESAAANAVRAKLLVISAAQDHCVNPAPALSFAKKLGARTIVLPEDDGHSAPWPNTAMLSKEIAEFLDGR